MAHGENTANHTGRLVGRATPRIAQLLTQQWGDHNMGSHIINTVHQGYIDNYRARRNTLAGIPSPTEDERGFVEHDAGSIGYAISQRNSVGAKQAKARKATNDEQKDYNDMEKQQSAREGW